MTLVTVYSERVGRTAALSRGWDLLGRRMAEDGFTLDYVICELNHGAYYVRGQSVPRQGQ